MRHISDDLRCKAAMATRPKAAVGCGAAQPSCTAGYEQIAAIDVMCVDSALVRGAVVDGHLDAVVGKHQVAQECLERARHGGGVSKQH